MIDARMDDHVYLAEILAEPHRVVRVESKPGPQTFMLSCGFDKGPRAIVDVRLGMITPVEIAFSKRTESGSVSPLLGATTLFEASLNSLRDRSYSRQVTYVTATAGEPLPYRPLEDMPYFKKQ
jgi:hypothetical protein